MVHSIHILVLQNKKKIIFIRRKFVSWSLDDVRGLLQECKYDVALPRLKSKLLLEIFFLLLAQQGISLEPKQKLCWLFHHLLEYSQLMNVSNL